MKSASLRDSRGDANVYSAYDSPAATRSNVYILRREGNGYRSVILSLEEFSRFAYSTLQILYSTFRQPT